MGLLSLPEVRHAQPEAFWKRMHLETGQARRVPNRSYRESPTGRKCGNKFNLLAMASNPRVTASYIRVSSQSVAQLAISPT